MPRQCSRDASATDKPDCCVLTILNRARTPFLRLQHSESTYLLRPHNTESFHGTLDHVTLTMGIRETLANV
eukprot:7893081-Pyramimonas_sp.AAC.1